MRESEYVYLTAEIESLINFEASGYRCCLVSRSVEDRNDFACFIGNLTQSTWASGVLGFADAVDAGS